MTLAADGGAGVLVLDPQGRILVINSIAARVYARRSAREATGLRLADIMPPPAATERLEMARQVIISGEPVVFRDLWSGYALRCTLRRAEQSPEVQGPAATLVFCLQTGLLEEESEDAGARILETRHVDYGPLAGLTNSELKVLSLLGEGLSNAEIAARLHRAVKTVESHRAALTEKTGATSRVQLGLMARRAGLAQRITINDHDQSPGRVAARG